MRNPGRHARRVAPHLPAQPDRRAGHERKGRRHPVGCARLEESGLFSGFFFFARGCASDAQPAPAPATPAASPAPAAAPAASVPSAISGPVSAASVAQQSLDSLTVGDQWWQRFSWTRARATSLLDSVIALRFCGGVTVCHFACRPGTCGIVLLWHLLIPLVLVYCT
ncbi:hypothetical protein IWX49DRAFT_581241 [Phyllosticta citricarpa]